MIKKDDRKVEEQMEYLAQMKTYIDSCLRPVEIFDKEGNRTGVFRMKDARGALKALEKLGKLLGMF